jgi:DNA-binding CsgD family transcriptional regulator/cell division protein FtsB
MDGKMFWIFIFLLILGGGCTNDLSNEQQHDFSEDQTNETILANEPEWQWLQKEFMQNKMLFDSLLIYETEGNEQKLGSVKIALAGRFRNSGNYEDGLGFLHEVLDAPGVNYPDSVIGAIYHELAAIYYEMYFHQKDMHQYLDSAEYYTDHFLEMVSNGSNNQKRLNAFNLKGAIFLQREEFYSAKQYLEIGNQIYQNDNKLFGMALLANLSYAELKTGNFTRALELIDQVHQLALESNNIVFMGSALKIKADIYTGLGDSDRAEALHTELRELTLRKNVILNHLLSKQHLLNYYRKQDQITILGLYKEHYFLFRLSWLLLIAFLILGMVSLTFIYLYRQNKKLLQANSEVVKSVNQNEELTRKNTQLEIQVREDREKALQAEIAAQKSALASKIITLSRLNDFLKKLKDDILSVKGEQGTDRSFLTRLEKNVSDHISNNLWNEFDTLFKAANNQFIQNLVIQHPDLTLTEKRLAYLILMNFSTKEISEIMAKNYRSVEMARFRLRTKLGLEKNENISAYLIKFAGKEF